MGEKKHKYNSKYRLSTTADRHSSDTSTIARRKLKENIKHIAGHWNLVVSLKNRPELTQVPDRYFLKMWEMAGGCPDIASFPCLWARKTRSEKLIYIQNQTSLKTRSTWRCSSSIFRLIAACQNSNSQAHVPSKVSTWALAQ